MPHTSHAILFVRPFDADTKAVDLADVEGLGTVVTIDPRVVARHSEIAARLAALGPVTRDNYQAADDLIGETVVHDRQVEEGRVEGVRPYNEVVGLMNDAARRCRFGESKKLGDRQLIEDVARIKAELAEEALAQAAERQRIADEAIALAERTRLEAEERQRQLDALAAEAATPADRLAVVQLEAEHHATTAREREEVRQAGGAAWVAAAQLESAPPPRSGASSRADVEVEVVDYASIPHHCNGKPLLVPDLKAIKLALQAGNVVPGCRLKPKTVVTAGRRR